MAVFVKHAKVIGLRVVFAHHAIPPEHTLTVHLRTPALGATIVAKRGVGGFSCRTVVNAVDARIFIHLVAILVEHAFDRGEGRLMEGDGASCTVFVLHRTVKVRLGNLIACRIADTQSTLLAAFFCGDKQHAVTAS